MRVKSLSGAAWLVLAPLLLLPLLPLKAAEQTLDRIVAVIGNEAVTRRELAFAVQRSKTMLAQQEARIPPDRVLASELLQEMIIRKLQMQEAEQLGIFVDEQSLDQAVESIAERNNITLAELREKTEAEGIGYTLFREKVREDIAINQLRQREVIEKIEVSEKEIQDQLAEQNADAEYRFFYVAVTLPDDKKQRRKTVAWAGKLRDKLAAEPGDFDAIARRAAQSHEVRSGSLGWRRAQKLPGSLAQTAPGMSIGEVTQLIRTKKTLYVLVMDGKRSDNANPVMQRQYRVRHILLRTNAMDTDAVVRKKLLKMKRHIQRGGDFSKLAKQFSQDPGSGFKGGDLSWVAPQNMVPEFAEKMRTGKRGEVVGPFQTAFGWHLMQVSGVREHDMGDEMQRREVIASIRKRKSGEATRTWLLRLRERNYIDVRL